MASERTASDGIDVIDDDINSSVANGDTIPTISTQEDHNDELTANNYKISTPAPSPTSSYYTSAAKSTTANYYLEPPTQEPSSPTPASSPKRAAATEYERLLSTTILSLLEKFIPVLQRHTHPTTPSKRERSGGQHPSLEIPSGDNHYKTTGLYDDDDDDNDQDDNYNDLLHVECQSNESPSFHVTATPKVSNLKTTGMDNSTTTLNDETVDIESPLVQHDDTSYHDQQQQQQQPQSIQRKHSNSTDYLPQSAATLLTTLQHANFVDSGAEEILSSILMSGGSFPPDETSVAEELNNSGSDDALVHSSLSNPQMQQQKYNFEDEEDENSISGDMARLSKSIAHLQRDLDNIDMSQFDGMMLTDEQDLYNEQQQQDGGWKGWIRNWLLSRGIIHDEKIVNALLSEEDESDGENNGGMTVPGRGGLSIFDFERDHVLVLTLLLVFFVLLRNRFKTISDLLFSDDGVDLGGLFVGSDW